jgi:hypothetical protein
MHTTLHVDGLASDEDGPALAQLFSAYGTVVYARVVNYPGLFLHRSGCGIVEMETADGARNAMRALNDDSEVGAPKLTVRAATAEEESAAGHPRMFTSMNMPDDNDDDTDQEQQS